MHLIRIAAVLWMGALISSHSYARSLTGDEQAILQSSISAVSFRFEIPLVVLYGVYEQEKGWPGAFQQVNGSADVGVFQINTNPDNWMPILRDELGLGQEAIQYSIAANTIAAGYILSEEYRRVGSWTEAVGNYHRHVKDSFRHDYQSRVVAHMMAFLRANPGLSSVGDPWARDESKHSTAQVTFE
jgi:hypothetical protein